MSGPKRGEAGQSCDAGCSPGPGSSGSLGVMTSRLAAFAAALCLLTEPQPLFAANDPATDQAPSRSSLFEDNASTAEKEADSGVKLSGFAEVQLAYTTPSPAHWSRVLTRVQVDATGAFSPNVNWKLSGRVDYDAVYDLTNFYLPSVADNARLNFFARENYVDVSANEWDFRFGRQQIVWGEMVALFAADVVSAKDLREFILPDFCDHSNPAVGSPGGILQGRLSRRVRLDSRSELQQDRRAWRTVLFVPSAAAARVRRSHPGRAVSRPQPCSYQLWSAPFAVAQRLGRGWLLLWQHGPEPDVLSDDRE